MENNKVLYKEDVCERFSERMHRKSKKEFRTWAIQEAQKMGYIAKEEKSLLAKNIVIGNPEKAEIIVGAHYDTPPSLSPFIVKHQFLTIACAYPLALTYSIKGLMKFTTEIAPASMMGVAINGVGVLAQVVNFGVFAYMLGFLGNANQKNYDDNSSGVLSVLNLMNEYKQLPKEQRDKIAFVLFDNEEKMLLGSLAYASQHKKEIKNQSVINLDCVGVAETMNLLYVGKDLPEIVKEFEKEIKENTSLKPNVKITGPLSMSDHMSFIGAKEHICLLAKDKSIYSLVSHIHSKKDNFIKEQNILDVVDIVRNYTNKKLFSTKKHLTQAITKEQIDFSL